MDKQFEATEAELIDLGAASTETKGSVGQRTDGIGKQALGLTDD